VLAQELSLATPEQNTTSERAASPKRRRPLLRAALGVLLGLIAVIAIALAILLTNANVLRTPINDCVSRKLDRTFAINGDLRIRLFPHARVELNDVMLENAAWGTRPNMAHLDRALIGIELLPLLHKRVVLPEVELTKPDILLERDEDGEANWTFGRDDQQPQSYANPPEIRALWIKEGKVAFVDPQARTDLALTIDSDRAPGEADSMLRFAGEGSLRDETFHLKGEAGSLLELKESGKPYKLDVTATYGATKASFDGSVVPLKLETIDGKLALSGDDLAKLYPLVPVPIPWTPAYRIGGQFLREGTQYSLRDLKGHVGSSDINGAVSVDIGDKRPVVKADLTSKRLDYKDLAGFLGAPPAAKGKPQPIAQKKEAAKREVTGKVLSEKPYDLDRLRSVDADVRFKGESIIFRDIPLDNITVALKLNHGKLTLEPLDFGLAKGHITSHIAMDASKDVIQTNVDATVKNLELKELMPKLKEGKGSAGKLGGRVKVATKGNSVAKMAASANGEIALIMGQGRASTLALVLTNLDLANATRYLLRGDPNAPIYCAVVEASAHDGKITPQIFVVDSSEEKITGEGDIDLVDEAYELRLVAHSKRPSIVALRGPIRIGGTLKHPQVRPEAGPLALRVGAAVALGTLLTPVASLLALIDPGGAKDSNCGALVERARSDVANTTVTPPKKASPARSSAEKEPQQSGATR
jgi:uncharacterized protein involved in outer membrane biogenesis